MPGYGGLVRQLNGSYVYRCDLCTFMGLPDQHPIPVAADEQVFASQHRIAVHRFLPVGFREGELRALGLGIRAVARDSGPAAGQQRDGDLTSSLEEAVESAVEAATPTAATELSLARESAPAQTDFPYADEPFGVYYRHQNPGADRPRDEYSRWKLASSRKATARDTWARRERARHAYERRDGTDPSAWPRPHPTALVWPTNLPSAVCLQCLWIDSTHWDAGGAKAAAALHSATAPTLESR